MKTRFLLRTAFSWNAAWDRFPPDLRPEVCITSFCRGDDAIKAEIRRVKTDFWKLGVFLHFRKVPLVHRLLVKTG